MVWMIPLDLFDEKCVRDMEAVAQYIDAYSGDQTRDGYPSYEKCLRYFLESSSLEECRRRVDAYCQEYKVPKPVRSAVQVLQKDYDIGSVVEDLHRTWRKVTEGEVAIPDYIDDERSCSIETLLMFGALSCMSFDTEPLKEEVLKKMQSTQKTSYPSLHLLDDQTRETFRKTRIY